MATYTIEGVELTAIADAIRAKLGVADTYTPSEMAAAIESISGSAISQADIPAYVRTAAEDLADRVRAVQTSSTITFLAMSDAHHLDGNANRLAAVQHAGMAAKIVGLLVPLDFAFLGGDSTDGSSSTTRAGGIGEIETVNEWLSDSFAGIPNFRTAGNHDTLRYNSGITPLTDAELYQLFGSHNDDGVTVMGSTTAGYCYRDIAAKSCRVVCLNTAESAKERVSDAQRLWFAQTLASTPSGYGIVVLSHHPLDWGDVNQCSEVLYQHYSKGSVTISGTTVSFASVNPAYVVCFHGHTHCYKADRMYRVQNSVGTPYDVTRIATPNACFDRNNEYGTNSGSEYFGIEYGETVTYSKVAGTAEDTAFVVNVIDPTNALVHSFHYGAGRDRAIGIGATVYHAVTATLAHVTSSNADTAIEDGTAYTTTLAAESGYDMQSVTVTMGGTDVTSTAYNSGTGVVTIASVTGDLTITATATEHVSYTNLVPTAVTSAGVVCGYKDGYYVSGSGKVGDFSASSGFTATGAMALPAGWTYIYVKGVPMLSGDSHERYYFGDSSKNVFSSGGYINATNYSSQYMAIETLGTNYYRISTTHTVTATAAFVAMSFKTSSGADLIITVDEPIE